MRNTLPYSGYLPIIQSSGMGKSRLVHQLAQSVFTIPFNLRNRDETTFGIFILLVSCYEILIGCAGFAYPFPDDDIRDLFLRSSFRKGHNHTVKSYLIFFEQLFMIIRETLQEERIRVTEPTDNALASEWSKYLGQPDDDHSSRTRLYKEVFK